MNSYCISDTHFGHYNIINYCDRPFTSKAEMDDTIIDNWNKKVTGTNDLVYHLGDFCLTSRKLSKEKKREYIEDLLKRLNGRIILICGSHDRDAWDNKDLFHQVYPKNTIVEIKHRKNIIIMGHCPMLSWEKRFHGSIHLFGHVHTSPYNLVHCQKKSYDVGVDNNNFTPILLDEAILKAEGNTEWLRK